MTSRLPRGLVPGRLFVVRRERGYLRGRVLAELSGRGIPDDGVEPVDDVELAADVCAARKRRADADEAADGRQHRQHRQRHPHRARRLVRQDGAVRVVPVPRGVARVVAVVYVVAVRVHALRLADRGRLKACAAPTLSSGPWCGRSPTEGVSAVCSAAPSAYPCACASSACPPARTSRKRSLPQKVIAISRVM